MNPIENVNTSPRAFRGFLRLPIAHLAGIFLGLNVLDGLLTKAGLISGFEANPIMSALLSYPSWAFWVFKIGMGILVVVILWKVRNKYPAQTKRILTILTVAMGIICLWNGIGLFVG